MFNILRYSVIRHYPNGRDRGVGLALGDARRKSRRVESGGYTKGDRISRRIAVSSIEEELKSWLRAAHDRVSSRRDRSAQGSAEPGREVYRLILPRSSRRARLSLIRRT